MAFLRVYLLVGVSAFLPSCSGSVSSTDDAGAHRGFDATSGARDAARADGRPAHDADKDDTSAGDASAEAPRSLDAARSEGGSTSDDASGGDAQADAPFDVASAVALYGDALPPDASTDAGEDGNTAGACAGSVSFRMESAGGAYAFSQSGDEEPNWFLLYTEGRKFVQLVPAEDDTSNCRDCSGQGFVVGIGSSTSTLPSTGVDEVWNGTFYYRGGTCPGRAACITPACAPVGDYIAEMCACPSPDGGLPSGCTSTTPGVVCLHVPFHYPTADTVVGTLPAY